MLHSHKFRKSSRSRTIPTAGRYTEPSFTLCSLQAPSFSSCVWRSSASADGQSLQICRGSGALNICDRQWEDNCSNTKITRFMGPIWGPPGTDRTQVGPRLAPWTLLSGYPYTYISLHAYYWSGMMTSSNGKIFRVTGHSCRGSHQWIPLTKASDAELWCFLWSAPE